MTASRCIRQGPVANARSRESVAQRWKDEMENRKSSGSWGIRYSNGHAGLRWMAILPCSTISCNSGSAAQPSFKKIALDKKCGPANSDCCLPSAWIAHFEILDGNGVPRSVAPLSPRLRSGLDTKGVRSRPALGPYLAPVRGATAGLIRRNHGDASVVSHK